MIGEEGLVSFRAFLNRSIPVGVVLGACIKKDTPI